MGGPIRALLRWMSWFGFFLLIVVGCASPVPKAIREPAPGDIRVDSVRADAERYISAQIRWGGSIVAVKNHKEETWLEIVARELGANGRPRETDTSKGRFIARTQGFLDPAIYATGRLVTVTGTVAEMTTRSIGEYPYHYPVVKAQTVYLWKPPAEKRDPFYYPPYRYEPWYPFYRPSWHYPYYYW